MRQEIYIIVRNVTFGTKRGKVRGDGEICIMRSLMLLD
jgi:hypothetical protein